MPRCSSSRRISSAEGGAEGGSTRPCEPDVDCGGSASVDCSSVGCGKGWVGDEDTDSDGDGASADAGLLDDADSGASCFDCTASGAAAGDGSCSRSCDTDAADAAMRSMVCSST